MKIYDTTYKYVKTQEDIAYFEGGWWMKESDRWKNEIRRNNFQIPAVKANHETKQIELDYTIYP